MVQKFQSNKRELISTVEEIFSFAMVPWISLIFLRTGITGFWPLRHGSQNLISQSFKIEICIELSLIINWTYRRRQRQKIVFLNQSKIFIFTTPQLLSQSKNSSIFLIHFIFSPQISSELSKNHKIKVNYEGRPYELKSV